MDKKEKSSAVAVRGNSKTFIMGFIFVAVLYGGIKLLAFMGIVSAYYLLIIEKICIDIILALGLNLITGITGQFSLGHAAFMALGAYTAATFINYLPNEFYSVIAVCILGTIAGGVGGLLLAIPTLRLKGDYLAIATLGFAEIIRIVILNVDQDILGGSAGISNIKRFSSFELIFFGMVLSFVIVRNFVKSSYGRACISLREDDVAAEAMGINITKMKLSAFVIGTMLAGFAGSVYSGYVGYIAPKDFGFLKSIDILMIVVLGGLGNLWGTVGAGILLNIVSTLLQELEELRMIIYALVLIFVMLFKWGESPVLSWIRDKWQKIKELPVISQITNAYHSIVDKQKEID